MRDVKKDILMRVYLVYLGILLFGLAIIGKAIYIYTMDGKELLEKAKKQEMRLFDVEAIRGNICAEDGTLLATSVPIFDVRMDVSSENITDDFFKNNVDSLSICLASLFNDRKPAGYRDLLWEARRNGERYLMIHRDLTYEQVKKLRTFPIFRLGKYRGGMIVTPQYYRELPYKNLARRTIGFENPEAVEKVYVGLEGYFTNELQGINGKRLMRRIGNGAWMPMDIDNQVEPQNGEDIITTLDINLQDLAEAALERELIADSADHGCVVVMEVQTGHIKAIANLGKLPDGSYSEIYNYAVGEATEPGSTFKLASFLVALEDGKFDLTTPVNLGNGTATYHGANMTDAHRITGILTAEQVFEKSSNVGTSKLLYAAYNDQPQRYVDGLYRMCLNKPLNLQIGGEKNPLILTPKSRWWSAVSLPWMSVGYEVKLTPLQLLTLYNAVANNGKMIRPVLVKQILRNGIVVQTFPTEVINPAICSPATLAKAKYLLEGVVDRGTATSIKNPLYRIAGKTGTAQLAENNRGYNQGTRNIHYKGSFIGYFPADHPRYSCIVVINNPSRGKYYGGAVAAPVFREISDRIYASMQDIPNAPLNYPAGHGIPFASAGTQEDLQEVYRTLGVVVKPVNPQAEYARPLSDSTSVVLAPQQFPRTGMPDVTGMGVKDAVFLLEQMGMRVVLNGKGNVVRQSVPPGGVCTRGTIVVLDLQTSKT